MRQVQEMAVEFVNALNAAAAAESECAKLRRLLEEERRLVQRLKQEKEDEAQMAKRKIVRMNQRLAEAQKDVDYATTRADVAENEWVKLKRELQEARDIVQLLKPESMGTRQIVLRQGDDIELELADALNVASIPESECDNLRTMLEEERKLVQRLIHEKDDEAQLAKRQIEDIGRELDNARKYADYATSRANVAEAKKELQEEKELYQLLKPECDEIRQSFIRQVEEKERQLVNALHASEIAEGQCAKLKRMLEEAQQLLQSLRLEKDDEEQLAKRQIEELNQELAHARKEAELSQKDADAAEGECAKLKRMLEEAQQLVQSLRLEKDDEVRLAKREIEELDQELAHTRKVAELSQKDADAAEGECAKLKRMLEESQHLVQSLRLERDEVVRLAKREIEELNQELAHARKEAELSQKDADAAEGECAKLERMLEESQQLVQSLRLEKDDEVQLAKREIEELDQELAHARKEAELSQKDADAAEGECAKLKRMLEESQQLVQSLRLERDEEVRLAKRETEELDQELAHARKEADLSQKDADAAEGECAKLKRMLDESQQLLQSLRLEKDEEVHLAKRQIEELDQELAHARKEADLSQKDADAAEGECAKLKRMLEESQQLVQRLRLEKDDEVRLAKREIEEFDQELAHARKEAELSQKDADAAESECAKLKRMLIEEGKTVERLIIEKDDEAELAKRQIEKMGQELAYARREAQYARNDADIAENEWTKVKGELKEKEELVKFLKLEIQETRQIAERQVEEIIQGLEDARKETEHARNDADIAQNEWVKAKKDLREKLELIEMLKLECLETRERAMRQVEEKELELADALNAATAASSSSAVAQECAICLTNEKDMAFGCGHMTCAECGMALSTCPICRKGITRRIKLFPG